VLKWPGGRLFNSCAIALANFNTRSTVPNPNTIDSGVFATGDRRDRANHRFFDYFLSACEIELDLAAGDAQN